MKIFEKLKSFFSAEKKLSEDKSVKLKISELDKWIASEKEKINSIKKQLKEEFDAKKIKFIEKISENIFVLKNVDLNRHKVEDKIKIAVKQGLLTYIMHLNNFLEAIEKINDDIELSLKRLDNYFAIFEKNSMVSYHKATILIGEEIEKATNNIKEFSKYTKSLHEENSDLFKKREILEKIIEINSKLEKIKDYKKKIDSLLQELKWKLDEKEKQKLDLEKKFEEFKKSSEYADELKQEEQLKDKQKQLQEEILNFRRDLNLKFLKKIVHEDEKKRNFVLKYENNLIDALREDLEMKIVDIVSNATTFKEHPLSLSRINKERAREIIEKSNELQNSEKNIKKSSLEYLKNIQNTGNAINDIKRELSSVEDKDKKNKEKEKEISSEISEKMKEFEEGLLLVKD